ncbi:MAG: tripartite tricarboxylate transporter permease [Synergistetes bacterium]|nr:tripartite tricarboxylate transporter permease [Synergistota bacterium]MCX8127902.1 tripartite tricarboxylate transporter permease [Synergistota bacterium]MDW8192164.1 tripartite tricarboxylate transporter permease [Synergistota bacterium]
MVSIADFFTLKFFALVFVGSLLGLVVGALPGLTVTMATALLVSITMPWPMVDALAVIMGVYVVGVYAGAISAVLINIPGAPSSVATTFDGFPLARQGKAKTALYAAAIHSFIGSIIGLIILLTVAKPVTKIALAFTPFDYFLFALFGLTMVGSLTSRSFLKGLISATIGVILSLVGMDPVFGVGRFTFGSTSLLSGINIVPALIGLFGFSEVLIQISQKGLGTIAEKIVKERVDLWEIIKHWRLSIQSSLIGTFIGALPGVGGPIAALMAYDAAKRTVKRPSKPFGEGAIEGVIASEAANNACIGGALIPMLTMAVPGDAVTAVMLAAFYVHGLRPGPTLFIQTPELFYAVVIGGFVGAFAVLILAVSLAPLLARVVTVPKCFLLPSVSVLCVIGAYAVNNSLFETSLMLLFGVLGFIMRMKDYAVAPLVLGLVLGNMMDFNLRKAVALAQTSDNFWLALVYRPITLVLILMLLFWLAFNLRGIKVFRGEGR